MIQQETHLSFCRLITGGRTSPHPLPGHPQPTFHLWGVEQAITLLGFCVKSTNTNWLFRCLAEAHFSPFLTLELSQLLDNIQVQYKHTHPSVGSAACHVWEDGCCGFASHTISALLPELCAHVFFNNVYFLGELGLFVTCVFSKNLHSIVISHIDFHFIRCILTSTWCLRDVKDVHIQKPV